MSSKKNSISLVINQVLKQHHSNFEVIVVDSASEDGTAEFIAYIAEADSRVVHILSSDTLNRSAARNIGARQASGERLVFMDDDCFLPNHSVLCKLEDIQFTRGFCAGAMRRWLPAHWSLEDYLDRIKEDDYSGMIHDSFVPKGVERESGNRDLTEFSFISHFGMIPTDFFHEIGGFDEGYHGWGDEDMDLMMRAMIAEPVFVNLFKSIEVIHLTHPVSRTDLDSKSINRRRYFEKQKKMGVSFRVDRLFGVDNSSSGPIIETLSGNLSPWYDSLPTISCIIPTRDSFKNKKSALRYTIESLSMCDYPPNLELIIVSSSNDETDDYVNSLQPFGCLNEIRLLRYDILHDRSGARNWGVEIAKNELLLFLDDDVIIANQDALARAALMMKEKAFACGAKRYWLPIGWNQEVIEEALSSGFISDLLRMSNLPSGINRDSGFRDLQEFSFIGHFGMIFKDDYQAIGGFDARNFPARREDNELMYRCLLKGFDYIHLFDDCDVIHLTHPAVVESKNERLEYHRKFEEWQIKQGFWFKANHLFGVSELDGSEILERIGDVDRIS